MDEPLKLRAEFHKGPEVNDASHLSVDNVPDRELGNERLLLFFESCFF